MDNAITYPMLTKVIRFTISISIVRYLSYNVRRPFLIIVRSIVVRFVLVPHIARTKTWKSCEANEIIFVWHHAEGLEPHWQPQTISHVLNRTWRYQGRNEFLINCHIQVSSIGLPVISLSFLLRFVQVVRPSCNKTNGRGSCFLLRRGLAPLE